MPNNYVHFPVSSADLRHVINVHGPFLAGLADEGAFFGTNYPAISTDDGASWSIAGPRMTRARTDGPHVTDRVGATSNNTVVLWGRGGSFVEALPPDAGHWYQAAFDGPVQRLTITRRRIRVELQGSATPEVSTDDGLRWSP